MSRLIKPTVYAKEHNISRQAVYAKIKKGILPSKRIEGKIYIIQEEQSRPPSPSQEPQERLPEHVDFQELLASKDETIAVLKESIQDLKATNHEINTTLRGEIELLKQVFAEMRNLYVKNVALHATTTTLTSPNEPIDSPTVPPTDTTSNERECWVDLESFLERAGITKQKKREKIKKRLLKAYKKQDPRIQLKEGTLFMSCYDFYEDIL